jgi:hypothetical protein
MAFRSDDQHSGFSFSVALRDFIERSRHIARRSVLLRIDSRGAVSVTQRDTSGVVRFESA